MVAREFLRTYHSSGTKHNLEIAFFKMMQLRVDKARKRDAYADNMVSVIPVDFSEDSRIEI